MKRKLIITVHPFIKKDRDGDPEFGDDFEIRGVLSWPAQSAELEDGGTITSDRFIFTPYNAAEIKATDNVTVKGLRYSVDGVPGSYEDFGKGTLIKLKRTGS